MRFYIVLNQTVNIKLCSAQKPKEWGNFLRYHYLQFDFTSVQVSGYVYGDVWKISYEYFSDQ